MSEEQLQGFHVNYLPCFFPDSHFKCVNLFNVWIPIMVNNDSMIVQKILFAFFVNNLEHLLNEIIDFHNKSIDKVSDGSHFKHDRSEGRGVFGSSRKHKVSCGFGFSYLHIYKCYQTSTFPHHSVFFLLYFVFLIILVIF